MQTRAARFRNRARQDNEGQITHPRTLVVDDEDRSTFPGKKRREGIPTIGLFGVTRLGDVYTYNTLIARVPDIDGMPALFADESDDENDTDDHVREQNLSRSRE